jgi:hypothetical protein
MKFSHGQVVSCDLYGFGFCKIIASKDQQSIRQLPFQEIVTPKEGYDYVIMPFHSILDDGNAWWQGELHAMENWLTDATLSFEEFYKQEMAKRRL